MSVQLKKWLPIGLCCLPGIAAAAILGAGVLLGGATVSASWGGPLRSGILMLALLACPLSMVFMMRRMSHNTPPGAVSSMATCCAPNDQSTDPGRLAALQAQREALERQVMELQARIEKVA
ncbi:MAG: DUF2933 domain-containing protein [Chloroflexi bacterium]|nr:DUF2933 domain-containing protein [Chloroflexota bacterium]